MRITDTDKRVRLLHLLGEFTHETYTHTEFEKDIQCMAGAHDEWIRACHDGDIEIGPPVRLSMAGKERLKARLQQ
jgi:hypothetical protein